jgi:hypothetical protein
LENQKTSSLSFIKELKFFCGQLNPDTTFAIENIITILENYKKLYQQNISILNLERMKFEGFHVRAIKTI